MTSTVWNTCAVAARELRVALTDIRRTIPNYPDCRCAPCSAMSRIESVADALDGLAAAPSSPMAGSRGRRRLPPR